MNPDGAIACRCLKTFPFNMHEDWANCLVNKENFHLAWAAVAAKRGCAGVDGVTIAQIAVNAERYWLTSSALKQVLTIGSSPPEPPPNAYII